MQAKLENAFLSLLIYPQCIFSVEAATKEGATVNFNANSAELVTKVGTIFPIQKHGRLYCLCKALSLKIEVEA